MTRSIKDNTSRKGNLCNPFVSSLYTAYIPERAFPIVGECSLHMKNIHSAFFAFIRIPKGLILRTNFAFTAPLHLALAKHPFCSVLSAKQ